MWNDDAPGEKGWGKCLAASVDDGHGVMVTKNIAVIRNCSYPDSETDPDKKGWHLQIGDIRTGQCLDIRVTPTGRKIVSGFNTSTGGDQ